MSKRLGSRIVQIPVIPLAMLFILILFNSHTFAGQETIPIGTEIGPFSFSKFLHEDQDGFEEDGY